MLFVVALIGVFMVGIPWLLTHEQDQCVADPHAEAKRLRRSIQLAVLWRRGALAGLVVAPLLTIVSVVIDAPELFIFVPLTLIAAAVCGIGWFLTRYPYARDRSGQYLDWDRSVEKNRNIHYPAWVRWLGRWLFPAITVVVVLVKCEALLKLL